jgi:hypothetical protein
VLRRSWFSAYAVFISFGAVALIAVGSLLIRRPFSPQYARESVPEAYWQTRLFLWENNVITAVWAAALWWARCAASWPRSPI